MRRLGRVLRGAQRFGPLLFLLGVVAFLVVGARHLPEQPRVNTGAPTVAEAGFFHLATGEVFGQGGGLSTNCTGPSANCSAAGFTTTGTGTFATVNTTDFSVAQNHRLTVNGAGGGKGPYFDGTEIIFDNNSPPQVAIGNTASYGAPVVIITSNVTAVGNAADTTEDTLMTFPLLANSIPSNTKAIRVTAYGDGVSTADVTTVRCYFGTTAVLTKVLTASQANTWRAEYVVWRTGAATQLATGTLFNGGTATSFVQSNSTPAETLSGGVTIKCTGQRATTSTANSVRQLAWTIESLVNIP